MIIATPLDLPKIEPDNWDTFWGIWHKNKQPLIKVKSNVDSSNVHIGEDNVWQGIDIYVNNNVNQPPAWKANEVDIQNRLPMLYNTLANLPIRNISRVRLIESQLAVRSHTDDNFDKWSVRAYFHYTDEKPQWYFTNPNDSDGARSYFSMPKETNWFAYNDKHCWHGTDYNPSHPKILLQVYMIDNPRFLIYNSMSKYKGHTVSL